MIRLHAIGSLAAIAFFGASAGAQSNARYQDAPGIDSRASGRQESWATERARALTSKAERYAARGDMSYALSAYAEAIRTDPSFGTAYLGLARLREAMSDFGEAERLYELAAQLPDSAAEALARRAELSHRKGHPELALSELEASVRTDPNAFAHLQTLSRWYAEARVWPAALATSRRLLDGLEASGASSEDIAAARVQVRALTVLSADADPVLNGRTHPSWVRRALSHLTRRALNPP